MTKRIFLLSLLIITAYVVSCMTVFLDAMSGLSYGSPLKPWLRPSGIPLGVAFLCFLLTFQRLMTGTSRPIVRFAQTLGYSLGASYLLYYGYMIGHLLLFGRRGP